MDTRKKAASSTTNLHQDRGKGSKFLAESQVVCQIFNDRFNFNCMKGVRR